MSTRPDECGYCGLDHPSSVACKDAAKPPNPAPPEFVCPGCGGTLFKVGEWQWHLRLYDAAEDEWDNTPTDYAEDHTIDVFCDDCGRDCTAEALAAGWDIEEATFTVKKAVQP